MNLRLPLIKGHASWLQKVPCKGRFKRNFWYQTAVCRFGINTFFSVPSTWEEIVLCVSDEAVPEAAMFLISKTGNFISPVPPDGARPISRRRSFGLTYLFQRVVERNDLEGKLVYVWIEEV